MGKQEDEGYAESSLCGCRLKTKGGEGCVLACQREQLR